MLCIVHSNFMNNVAGVEKVLQDQQASALARGMNFIAVFPVVTDKVMLGHHVYSTTGRYQVVVNGSMQGSWSLERLMRWTADLNLLGVVVHHLKSYPNDERVILWLRSFQCPRYFYVHDYASICANHALLKNNRTYCGPDSVSLSKCGACRFYPQGRRVSSFYATLFSEVQFDRIIFPSTVALEIWSKTHGPIGLNRAAVIPHQTMSPVTKTHSKHLGIRPLRLAFVGYDSRVKGWDTFVRLASLDPPNIDLYVVGRASRVPDGASLIPVSFLQSGPDAMSRALIDSQIDVALLWSIRPETYGFTFYESYIAGAFIVANGLSGNIAAQVRNCDAGLVFSKEADFLRAATNGDLRRVVADYFSSPRVRPSGLIVDDTVVDWISSTAGEGR